jgi:hypothetical protein
MVKSEGQARQPDARSEQWPSRALLGHGPLKQARNSNPRFRQSSDFGWASRELKSCHTIGALRPRVCSFCKQSLHDFDLAPRSGMYKLRDILSLGSC